MTTTPEPAETATDGQGEPAELRSLPREVRHLVHAVDRMRSDWLESGPQRCDELMQRVYEACDAVWERPLSVVVPAGPAPATDRAERDCKFEQGCHRVVACEPGCAVAAARMHAQLAAAPAVWIDGHPQLEAIAAAVWEQCGRSDSGTCVDDDPRNIAVAALTAVLPAPVDPAAIRATALREAADRIAAEIRVAARLNIPDPRLPGLSAAVDGLRAMADCPACAAGIEHDVHCPTPESHNWGCGCPSDTAAAIASCPGREMNGPSPCRCPCKGCEHHCAAHDPRRMADETPQPEAPAEPPPVCEGFVWIGQSFAICDRCSQPAWDHAGEDVPVEGAGPFDTRRTVRPWKPGEADAIRAKWSAPAAVAQPDKEA